MDFMRSGYQTRMQTWQQNAIPAARMVWYRVPADRPWFKDLTPFRSLNWTEPKWKLSEGLGEQRENICDRDCVDYYKGLDLWRLPGDHVCGSLDTWRNGGVIGVTSPIAIDEDGGSECCERPMGGPHAHSSDATEEFFVATAVGLVSGAIPMLSAAKLGADNGTPQALPVDGIFHRVECWGDPTSGTSFPFDGYDIGGFWSAADPFILTVPHSGLYRVTASLTIRGWGQPFEATIALRDPVGLQVWAYDVRSTDGVHGPDIQCLIDAELVLGAGLAVSLVAGVSGTGSGGSVTIGVNTDGLALRMIAPLEVHAGPTGICNELTIIGSFGPGQLAPCVKNPSVCACPIYDQGGGPHGHAGRDFSVTTSSGEGPHAHAGEATEAFGEGGGGPHAHDGDATEGFEFVWEGPHAHSGDATEM